MVIPTYEDTQAAPREACMGHITFSPKSIRKVGFPGGSAGKNLPANSGDTSSIPGSGKSPGERYGNPLQYLYLGYPVDRGDWWVIAQGVTNSQI